MTCVSVNITCHYEYVIHGVVATNADHHTLFNVTTEWIKLRQFMRLSDCKMYLKWGDGCSKRVWKYLNSIITNCEPFDVHVTVHRDKFLIIKPTRCTNFSNLFLEWNSTCFGRFLCPSSGVFHCTHSNGICQQTCMTYTIVVCTEKNAWWWTKELSETCRVSFQK